MSDGVRPIGHAVFLVERQESRGWRKTVPWLCPRYDKERGVSDITSFNRLLVDCVADPSFCPWAQPFCPFSCPWVIGTALPGELRVDAVVHQAPVRGAVE